MFSMVLVGSEDTDVTYWSFNIVSIKAPILRLFILFKNTFKMNYRVQILLIKDSF